MSSDSSPIIKQIFEATEMMGDVSNYLDKIPFFKKAQENETLSNEIGWYFNVLPFEQIKINKEDNTSRLYFTEKTIKGGFDLGLKGSIKYTVWGIPYDKLEKLPVPEWAIDKAKELLVAEVNLVLNADAKGEVVAEAIERKYVESDQWNLYKEQINPASVSFGLSGGVEGVFKVLEDNEWFSIEGKAEGLINAEIINIGYIDGKFGIYPLREGVNLDLKTSAFIKFRGYSLNTEEFNERISIIDPF